MSDIKSKYPEAAEEKISLGPVFGINPRYVKRIVFVCHEFEPSWLEIHMISGRKPITTELENNSFCSDLVKQFLKRNPAIELERAP